MNLAHTDEQRLLQDTLRKFLQTENDFEQRRKRLNARPPERMALWSGLAGLGLIGAAFGEDAGGYDGSPRMLAVAMAELGRSLAVEPYLGCALIAGRVLAAQQDAAARAESIGRIVAGERVVVLAHDAGADPYAQPLSTARADAVHFVLSGKLRCVRHADVASEFLVSAVVDGQAAVFRVPRESLQIAVYRMMDGAGAADLVLDGLRLPQAARLQFGRPALAVIADALDAGLLGLAAETAGIVDAVTRATFQYLNTRKQFGVPLASFQALQHRAADMEIAARELVSMLELAVEGFALGASAPRTALLAALKVLADTAGRKIGHEAVQLHGGMGVSDELDISHYARRLATIRTQLGSADIHRRRFGTGVALGELLALQDTPEARDWRANVRSFTEHNLPPRIAAKSRYGYKVEKEDYVDWQKILRDNGLFAGAWPREHGGPEWNLVKQLLFIQESAVAGASMISPYGVNMVGPVLYTFGNEAQRKQHLPGILSSDVWWCQGYSEPGSGSDLASLKTYAERDGDHYVVNGAKLWTTEAHWADWMHCLVRTDRNDKPQRGISFLLIDMKTPGISIKPIVTIDGIHHTNATFLDNVRVPVANRVGEEGQGWSIAKFLLSKERVSIADTGPKLRLLAHIKELFHAALREPQLPMEQAVVLANKLADVSIQVLTLCTMERQYVEAWAAGAPFGAEASVLKIRGTELQQALCELAVELQGAWAGCHDPEDAHRDPAVPLTPAQASSLMAYEYLYSRCWSIFGGTNEIQRNIIAKQILGV